MNKIITLLITISLLLSVTQNAAVFAASIPSFPSCNDPKGQLTSEYDSGIHGIAGKSGSYEGKDSVYSVNDNQLTQCYCPSTSSDGIQTNWVKASQFSADEQKIMQIQGWIFIPDGSAWGLGNSSYLAQNISFSCSGSEVGGSSDNNNGKSNGQSTQSILGAATSTLGSLASTGNLVSVFGFLVLGLFLLISSLFIAKNNK